MRLKLDLAGQLRALMETFKKRASETRYKQCEELMEKLANDRFTLAVLGQFKRGKSSLMNAIIGRELLPVGVLPLTSAITVLKFGPAERLVIKRKNSVFSETEPIDALADFVTERGNPGNCKRVKTATIEVPLPFLRRGLEFVDTPGIGSAIEANTATTHEFLPECDAALFVTSTDTPLTNTELDFLRSIRKHARKIFYVLNKIDLLSTQTERREVVDFIHRSLEHEINTGHVRVFPISARLALNAKVHRNGAELEESGLNVLEEELAAFLSREKASVFLTAIIDRIKRLLDQESGEVTLFKRASEIPESERDHRLEEIRFRFKQSADERKMLFEGLRKHLTRKAENALVPEIEAFLSSRKGSMTRYIRRTVLHARWMFGSEVCERCGSFLSDHIRKQTQTWLQQWSERQNFDSDTSACATWEKILTRLNDLPQAAATSFEISLPPCIDEGLPWKFELKIKSPFMHERDWTVRTTSLLSFSPSIMRKGATIKFLQSECERLIAAVREFALASVVQGVSESLQSIEKEIDTRAQEVEDRLEAAIMGTQPPRRSPLQGMDPPERLNWGHSMLESIEQKLITLRSEAERLAGPGDHYEDEEELPGFTMSNLVSPSQVVPPKFRKVEMSIAARLTTRGCSICSYLEDVVFNFFAKTQYDLYLDEAAQSGFATTRGFCSLHMWQLHAVSSPLGESVGLSWLVKQTCRILEVSSSAPEPQAAVSVLLPGTNDCRVCNLLKFSEREFIEQLAAFLGNKENQNVYSRSQGVCLRHLFAVIDAMSNEETTRFLLAEAARHFGETAEDMESYAMKRMAARGPLTNANENDASMRALVHLAGQRNLCAPWPTDGEI